MNVTNPLSKFSLLGQGHTLAEKAIKQEPLLGEVSAKGQITVWYAPPNTGKTLIALALITDAVANKRIQAENIYYINADDSQAGFAAKVGVLDDFGVHSLVPGQNGFQLAHLLPSLEAMVESGDAQGQLVIVDTVKKVEDIMDKRRMREFGIRARAFVMAGGSLLFLAHTNKRRSANNKLIHAGTNDLLEDVDCAYMLDKATSPSDQNERLIQFECLKTRGASTNECYYRYDARSGLDYYQRLLSVEVVDPTFAVGGFEENKPEALLIESISKAIEYGKPPTKGRIVSTVSKATKASKRDVLAVLERHTGPDPAEHLWDYQVQARGAHVFRAHEKRESENSEAA